MLAALREWLLAQQLTLFLGIVGYFWANWMFKLLLAQFYRPIRQGYGKAVSVIMPVYNEDREVLRQSLSLLLARPAWEVAELIVITDRREPDLIPWLKANLPTDARLRLATGQFSGKRFSLRLGIELARSEVVVSVESDVLVRPDAICELIKPFDRADVGGVVGDQQVYEPLRTMWTFFDFLCEKVKYSIGYPAFSLWRQVPVLAGRTVAYRRAAVLPLLDGLTHETFLGRRCISGDDGRITSLLLESGWRTLYQATAVVETISPDSPKALFMQRTRWYRNTCRRTLRALFWDRLWVWRSYPLVTWGMIAAWLNPLLVGVLLFLLGHSLWSGHFWWFGPDAGGVTLRIALLLLGLTLTRSLRAWPGYRALAAHRPGWRWFLVLLLPFYLVFLWLIRLYAIATFNRQGWVTRQTMAAGGVNARFKS
ncbi:glycosyltransferase [Rhabdochromatium marinum]|uniref:glycosyltransferase n=1 Tax=Rhabdochromatium marinum TaxID=48729 RepID=UPI0019037927|nr:glycosyltransferase [Rhabdochromatium marinum]MBK1648623.1 hypothetical protein [Rhabdochromatium marinum]